MKLYRAFQSIYTEHDNVMIMRLVEGILEGIVEKKFL